MSPSRKKLSFRSRGLIVFTIYCSRLTCSIELAIVAMRPYRVGAIIAEKRLRDVETEEGRSGSSHDHSAQRRTIRGRAERRCVRGQEL